MNPEDLALAYLRSIDTHRDTEWFEAPCANPIDVADAEIEPWFHDMFEHLKKATGATAVRSNGYTFDMPDLKAIQVFSMSGSGDAAVLTTKLSLVRLNVGFFVLVSGTGDDRQDEISVWSAAIDSANAKLGQAHPEHAWWAVLGPDSRRRGMMRPFVGAADLGRVSLRAGDFGYRETVPVSLRGSFHLHDWIPVIVHGRTVGYDWNSAAHAAHRELYTIAALLSLESGDHWTLRERPTPIEWGAPVLAESVGPLQRLTNEEEAERRREAAAVDVERLSNAWRELQRESRLLRPLSAYYQGVGLLDEHPSFAVVAFVAAIEEIGKLVIESEKPELCPTCKRPKLSSRALFRKTLELVRSRERAAELADNLYPWRSATAHSGHLFGYETAFGNQPFHLAMPSTVADIFQGAARVRARDAAKDLLHLVLTGALQLRGASKRAP